MKNSAFSFTEDVSASSRKSWLVFFCTFVCLLAFARPASDPAAEMPAAARMFLDSLDPAQRALAVIPFADEERMNWHFIPRERRGVPYRQLSPQQREFGDTLLRAGLGPDGLTRVANIRSLDQVLFEESRNPIRDPDLYFFSIFGDPAPSAEWGWRLEGHHVSLNFALRGGRVVSWTPFFLGANPAEVRRGSRTGLRTLAPEEDMGRQLFRSLEGQARAAALINQTAPEDIVTGASRKAEIGTPAGLPAARMTPAQVKLLIALVELYAHRLRPELAEAELARIRKAGIEKIYFAWAGGSEPRQPHYYRIHGATFLIEYDNTQNNANHIHTVWRDPEHDFGLDPLRAHYSTSSHHRKALAVRGALQKQKTQAAR